MVKFGKSKLKALNKLVKKQTASASTISNKILKKKINAEKKVTFQKEVLLKETASSPLVKNVTSKVLKSETSEPPAKRKVKPKDEVAKLKQKSVEKQKKRQKTQISDTKLLLNLMKKK